ncbi:MAG: MBL fold metallo-hydrolase [Cloacibacillus sp.]
MNDDKKYDNAADFSYPENFLRYLGTSGGRFSMIKQARSTGGIWFRYGGINCVVDPGPGSLAQICAAQPALDSAAIDVVMLTHKHIDHSTDANVLIECMTQGGFEDRGLLVAPQDAMHGSDPVVLKYSQAKAHSTATAEDGMRIELGRGVTAEPVAHFHHGVDCFGYVFRGPGLPEWGLISDTKLLPSFSKRYEECSYLSINVTFPNRKLRLDHMSIEELRGLLTTLHPKTATLSHLGAMMTSPEGEKYLRDLDTPQTKVVPGEDGMIVDLDSLAIYRKITKPVADKFMML